MGIQNVPSVEAVQEYVKDNVGNWDATKTYAINDLAIDSGSIYKSLTNGNLNNQPSLDLTETNWELASGGGGGASTTEYTAAMDFTLGQPIAVAPGNIDLELNLAAVGGAFDTPVEAYFVIALDNDVKILVYFVTDTNTPAPSVGQTHEFQIFRASYATSADVRSAAEDLIGHFGVYSVNTDVTLTTSISIICDTSTYSPSIIEVGTAFSYIGTASPTSIAGQAVVASLETLFSAEVVGITQANALSGNTVVAQKIALLETIPSGSIEGGTFTVGLPVFLGRGGVLTQDVSNLETNVYRTYLGVATATDAVDVLVQESVAINDTSFSYDAVPIGTIAFSSTTALQPGWLRPEGQAISRTNYSSLNTMYASESYPYGSGDGSTTFNLPNYADPAAMIKVRYTDDRLLIGDDEIDGGSASTSF